MLTWYIADFVTGGFVDEIPIRANSIERTIGKASTCQVTLDIADPSCPSNWPELFDGRRAMLVPVNDDVPLCGYLLDDAVPGDPALPFSLTSLEAVPDRVNVRSHEFFAEDIPGSPATDEADVAAALLNDVIAPAGGFELVVTKTGKSADHTYSFYEDVSVGTALSELSSQEGGPEWVTRIRWEDSTHRRFIKTMEIGPKVGRDMRSTVFENVHLADRKRPRSWRNLSIHTIATGDGSGESRLMSAPYVDQAAIDAGIFPWEMRVAVPSIRDVEGLNRVADQTGSLYRYGTQRHELELAQLRDAKGDKTSPWLVEDYDVGDTVYLDLAPTRFDPVAVQMSARVIGWRANVLGRELVSVSPSFWSPDEGALT